MRTLGGFVRERSRNIDGLEPVGRTMGNQPETRLGTSKHFGGTVMLMNLDSKSLVKRMVSAWFMRALLPGLALCLASQGAWAQANRGSITGTVTDPSTAVVGDVTVTATNTATGVPATTVSNGEGIYVIPNLPPGVYTVEFRRDGFETLVHPDVTVNSTEVVRVDATLHVGAVTATVTVSGGAPVIDMDSAAVGTNMKATIVNDLPLSIYGGGRFVEDFAVAITPGYSPVSSPYGAVVNGGQWFTKDYTIDGTSGTSSVRGDSMDGGPSMEAVEELQAQTSGLDAESSITGGGVMSFNLKSGTNKFHGSAFLYGHNELLDANTWTNDSLGLGKPKERAWDDGFSLGGPIHKNKTFLLWHLRTLPVDRLPAGHRRRDRADPEFLKAAISAPAGADALHYRRPRICAVTLQNYGTAPGTPIMVTDNAGQPLQARENMIYDPLTGNQFTGQHHSFEPDQPGGAEGQWLLSNYKPQLGGIDNNARTLLSNTPSQTPIWVVVKLDHVLRDQDHLSGSWIYDHKPRTLDDGGGVWQEGTQSGGPLSNARVQMYRQQQWRLSEQHTFTPRMLNVVNFTYSFDFNGSDPADPGDWNSQMGFGDHRGAINFPLISFSDNPPMGTARRFWAAPGREIPKGCTSPTGDTLTWTKGRHNFSFGGDFDAHEINSHSGSGAYSFNFDYNTLPATIRLSMRGCGL